MSQRRLIVSLALISSCLALVIALAAWTFPLKAQGVTGGVIGGVAGGVPGGVAHAISGGVAGGVSNGITNGIKGGISGIKGGIKGGIAALASGEEPSVDYSTVWTDKVKRGAMPLQVRGAGTLVRGENSGNLIARVTVPAPLSDDVKSGETAEVGSNNPPVNWGSKGRVISVGPVSNGTRTVDIALDSASQAPAAGFKIMASIDIGKLDNVLFVGRPVNGAAESSVNLFKISNDGSEAVRTLVKLGRASVNTIEILEGLQDGDKVILSDMSSVANAERIHMTRH